jgi:hypothetical protein
LFRLKAPAAFKRNEKSLNSVIAGIIPVFSGGRSVFNMPYHDSFMFLDKGVTLIEQVIATVVAAGCRSVWIVCDDSMGSLLRYRIGEFVKYEDTDIPVYYIPLRTQDKRLYSLNWSAFWGCYIAYDISRRISKWMIPHKYLIWWPHSVATLDAVKNKAENLHTLPGDLVFCGAGAQPVVLTADKYNEEIESFLLHAMDNDPSEWVFKGEGYTSIKLPFLVDSSTKDGYMRALKMSYSLPGDMFAYREWNPLEHVLLADEKT